MKTTLSRRTRWFILLIDWFRSTEEAHCLQNGKRSGDERLEALTFEGMCQWCENKQDAGRITEKAI
jgi:hypothetical protein